MPKTKHAHDMASDIDLMLEKMRTYVYGMKYSIWRNGIIEEKAVDRPTFDSITSDVVDVIKRDTTLRRELAAIQKSDIEKQQIFCEMLMAKYLMVIDNTSETLGKSFEYSYLYNILKMQFNAAINEFRLSYGGNAEEQLRLIKKSLSLALLANEVVRISNILDAYKYLSAAEESIDKHIAEMSRQAFASISKIFSDDDGDAYPMLRKEKGAKSEDRDPMYM
ncbi:MAG: hypothetical protein QXR73_02440 [Candidatus Micrarchaeaceae archaeon]